MRIRAAFAVGVFALFAAPAGAQTLRLSPGSLFEAPQSVQLERLARTALRKAQQKQLLTSKSEPSQKPRVVCGMMVIPADPKIDAAIRHPISEGDASKFTLKIVTPPACQR